MDDRTNHFTETRVREIEAFEARARGRFSTRNGAATMHTTPHDLATSVADQRQRRSLSMPTDDAAPAASLLDVILRAGCDPAFDVEKFERLVAIQREEQERQDARADRAAELAAEAAFDAALSEVQGKMKHVAANQHNSQTRSNYADYAAFDRMLRPIYAPAGFSLSFDEEDSPKPDHIRVVCWMTHVAPGAKRSHKRKYHADMPADGKGARGGDVMTKTHATGSAFTYGKRYVVGNIFNIAVSKDDDGNAASAKPVEIERAPGTITAAQAAELRQMLDERRISHRAFLQFVRLPRIEDIGAQNFDRAVAKIKTFGRQS
jgi:hypothetical protein